MEISHEIWCQASSGLDLNYSGLAQLTSIDLTTDLGIQPRSSSNWLVEQLPGLEETSSVLLASDQSWPTGETSLIPLSIDVQNRLMANARTATINVNYHDYSPQAQTAFQYAVSIWESLVVSTVPITIDAYWQPLDPGVLGQSGPNSLARDSNTNTWYVIALANQLAGQDLDLSNTDMTSRISSTFNWYFGTDGNTPGNQVDLVTVALHEILHGLGNVGLMQYSNGEGSWGFGTGFPAIYDRFTENGAGQGLINTSLFPNPSVALGNQLTSNNLFFDGPNAVAANNGNRPQLYAPSQWAGGSSYAHLDEGTYGRGNPNSLDTPFVAYGEAIHNPGPIPLGILKDEGWNLAPPPQRGIGDGKGIIMLQDKSNTIAGFWGMTGTTPTSWTPLLTNGFRISGVGDFTGDSQADILLQDESNTISGIWGMSGTTPISWTPLLTNGFRISGVGDFTGDDQADILLQDESNTISGIWGMSGATPISWTPLLTNGFRISGVGDFTGDGQADILLQDKSNMISGIWGMSGATPISWTSLLTNDFHISGAGDFTGDGQADILLQDESNTISGIWGMSGATPISWTSLLTNGFRMLI
jgi:hypothetical protein